MLDIKTLWATARALLLASAAVHTVAATPQPAAACYFCESAGTDNWCSWMYRGPNGTNPNGYSVCWTTGEPPFYDSICIRDLSTPCWY
jgi:hypothetical protein